jgi:hypothetical protein
VASRRHRAEIAGIAEINMGIHGTGVRKAGNKVEVQTVAMSVHTVTDAMAEARVLDPITIFTEASACLTPTAITAMW